MKMLNYIFINKFLKDYNRLIKSKKTRNIEKKREREAFEKER
jgi:hypothetical protein